MKNLLILLAMVFSVAATAQISVSADAGILFSEYAQSRSGNAGFSTGVRFEVPFGPFAISSGVEKTNYGKQYNFVNQEGLSEDPGVPNIDVTSFNYSYVGIPLRVKYNWKMLYAQVGVKAEFFQDQSLNNEGMLTDPAYLEEPFRDLNTVRERNFTTEFSLGFNYSPKYTNFGLYFEPTVSYMNDSIYEGVELPQKQLAYGLKVGAKYTFKK